MNENTIVVSKDEYQQILELAYKAAMLKEAVLDGATLGLYGNDLYFGAGSEVAAIFKYAFPRDYWCKLRELKDKKKAEDAEQMEPTASVKEVRHEH